jgi:hypothetical protein
MGSSCLWCSLRSRTRSSFRNSAWTDRRSMLWNSIWCGSRCSHRSFSRFSTQSTCESSTWSNHRFSTRSGRRSNLRSGYRSSGRSVTRRRTRNSHCSSARSSTWTSRLSGPRSCSRTGPESALRPAYPAAAPRCSALHRTPHAFPPKGRALARPCLYSVCCILSTRYPTSSPQPSASSPAPRP